MVDEHVHVYVTLERDEHGYPPFDVEEIDAVGVGGGEEFRIVSAPAFAYGIAPGDVVRAVRTAENGRLLAVEVLRSSQNWVARVIPRGGYDVEAVVGQFTTLGCEALLTPHGLITVVVPPDVEASTVLASLREGQDSAHSWFFDLGVSPDL